MWKELPAAGPWQPYTGLSFDRPHSARMYDYFLGGKTNFPADRAAAKRALAAFPHLHTTALENRAFLLRAARHLVSEAGVRQFLDIGTGIPTSPNLHEVVQGAVPEARVVYVDNDPVVLAHARALITSSPSGRTACVEADLREPTRILGDPALREVLDLDQPVALTLGAVLHFLPDETEPYGIVTRLVQALAPGSYLTLSHVTGDYAPERWKVVEAAYEKAGIPAQVRNHAQVARFCSGMELLEPGVVPVHWWRPDTEADAAVSSAAVSCYGLVARVP